VKTRAPYGRRKLSGSAALTTEGDGWAQRGLARDPETTGPFGRGIEVARPVPTRMAKAAVERVKRKAAS
jgi:hypothetical protein